MTMFRFSSSRPRRRTLLAFGMWMAALYAPLAAAQRPAPAPASTSTLPTVPTPLPSALNNGSPQEASKYYKELSGKLGLLTPTTIEAQANVKVLLNYLGYQEFSPEDIEFATPESLMAPAPGKPGTGAPVLRIGSKVSLQSDTGSFFARCRNCQSSVNNGAPDSITTHITSPNPVPFIVFEVVDAGQGKIALKADTGQFVARCLNCIIGGRFPDFVTVHAIGPIPPPFAQFTPEVLPNGKIALKADTGKYVNRCRGCSSATASDTVTINVTDPLKDTSAQWTVVTRAPGPTPAPAPRPGEILVSRFFAPKIVNFAVSAEKRQTGWRRLVRINSRPGSEANKHFVESAWILFNHFTGPDIHSPFGGSNVPTLEVKPSPWGNVTVSTPPSKKNSSVNTQVALVTRCPESTPQCQGAALNSIYWLDFGPSEKGYKLSYQLDAFFDAGSLPGDKQQAPYFVPNGCDTCHGSLRGNAVLNHLDTDHWMDRLADGDFPALARPEAPAVLFDAGKDIKSPQYAAAFDVLRRLNQEIATMQQRTNPAGFHLAATRKWLEMHQTAVAPELDLVKRSVNFFNTGHPLKKDRKPSSAPLNWTASAEDRELIGLMNKYCYRCHGAVRFDVFSKDMVADESSPILDRLDPNPTQQKILGFKMPVDRDMDPKDKQRLMELIEKLYDETH
ncbi:putative OXIDOREDUCTASE PROTEIN [Cystobacter fuscus DSM 2262]|uniref:OXIDOREDUCTASE PROTEIN n=2 Tax=Cystobacter fuscus TaxID=43 RepID=S9QWC3_CYSF2|nr:putative OXIDOREDUCTASE PROTEIN [Cystobacter fuscus DSM 2262]